MILKGFIQGSYSFIKLIFLKVLIYFFNCFINIRVALLLSCRFSCKDQIHLLLISGRRIILSLIGLLEPRIFMAGFFKIFMRR